MIDPKEFNFVSQMSHWLAGCLFVVVSVFLFGPHALWYSALIFTVYASIKEFWYDYHFETTEIRGSSLEDFLFYEAGVSLGIITVFMQQKNIILTAIGTL